MRKNTTIRPNEAFETDAAGLTDQGKVRYNNEDAFCVNGEMGLYVVSDGMGGHNGGEVASNMIIELLPELIKNREQSGPSDETVILKEAVLDINDKVCERGANDEELLGMGATVTALWFKGKKVFVAHVGDSRLYRVRKNQLTQLTDDHSVVGALIQMGQISAEEARVHPAKHILTSCIGSKEPIDPEVQSLRAEVEDRYLLCSDGLTNMLPDDRIYTILSEQKDAQKAAQELIRQANDAGGEDNITVIVLMIKNKTGK